MAEHKQKPQIKSSDMTGEMQEVATSSAQSVRFIAVGTLRTRRVACGVPFQNLGCVLRHFFRKYVSNSCPRRRWKNLRWRRTLPDTSKRNLITSMVLRGTALWAATTVRWDGAVTKTSMCGSLGGGSSRKTTSAGSYVTHESKHFIYFYIGPLSVLLFKSG